MSSLSDLHYKLGKLVEDRPGIINRPDNPHSRPLDSNERHFEGLSLDCVVRGVSGAGQQHIDFARESMGESRWQQLQAEWVKPPVCSDIVLGEQK